MNRNFSNVGAAARSNSIVTNVANMAVNAGTNLMNSFFPAPVANAAAVAANNAVNNASSIASKIPWGIVAISVLLITIIVLVIVFYDQLRKRIADMTGKSGDVSKPATDGDGEKQDSEIKQQATAVVNAIIPGHKEVFHVMDNKYAYEDAEPLCKALGAELATYDQVRDAWKKGADWCSYGWVKGQAAVYPTSDETWQKLQQGPNDQKNACGLPGLNGGYFDNDGLRFGVNCYGSKPAQGAADAAAIARGDNIPKTPAVIEYDNKVAKFRSEKYNTAVAPFNQNMWSN
jgi:hypothetical protein